MSFRFLTAGESHGRGLVGIIEGLPAGLRVQMDYIMTQMRRRKQGYGRGGRMKIEDDAVDILTGIRHEMTLGGPVTLAVWNKDFKSWEDI